MPNAGNVYTSQRPPGFKLYLQPILCLEGFRGESIVKGKDFGFHKDMSTWANDLKKLPCAFLMCLSINCKVLQGSNNACLMFGGGTTQGNKPLFAGSNMLPEGAVGSAGCSLLLVVVVATRFRV